MPTDNELRAELIAKFTALCNKLHGKPENVADADIATYINSTVANLDRKMDATHFNITYSKLAQKIHNMIDAELVNIGRSMIADGKIFRADIVIIANRIRDGIFNNVMHLFLERFDAVIAARKLHPEAKIDFPSSFNVVDAINTFELSEATLNEIINKISAGSTKPNIREYYDAVVLDLANGLQNLMINNAEQAFIDEDNLTDTGLSEQGLVLKQAIDLVEAFAEKLPANIGSSYESFIQNLLGVTPKVLNKRAKILGEQGIYTYEEMRKFELIYYKEIEDLKIWLKTDDDETSVKFIAVSNQLISRLGSGVLEQDELNSVIDAIIKFCEKYDLDIKSQRFDKIKQMLADRKDVHNLLLLLSVTGQDTWAALPEDVAGILKQINPNILWMAILRLSYRITQDNPAADEKLIEVIDPSATANKDILIQQLRKMSEFILKITKFSTTPGQKFVSQGQVKTGATSDASPKSFVKTPQAIETKVRKKARIAESVANTPSINHKHEKPKGKSKKPKR